MLPAEETVSTGPENGALASGGLSEQFIIDLENFAFFKPRELKHILYARECSDGMACGVSL